MPKENEQKMKTITYVNGDIYEGEVDGGGRPHGRGTYTHHQGTGQYVGDWKDGKKHGMGTYQHPNGDLYEGSWKDDEKHGIGKHSYRNGDIYEGPWVKGKKQGPKGKYTYKTNSSSDASDVYVGDWYQGEKDGEGTMKFANGDKYKGRWITGRMETLAGETATCTFGEGSKYVGKHSIHLDISFFPRKSA